MIHTHRFVVPDGRHLRPEHDRREQREQEALKNEEEEEHDGGGGREGGARLPLAGQAAKEVGDGQEEGVERHGCDVELKGNRDVCQVAARRVQYSIHGRPLCQLQYKLSVGKRTTNSRKYQRPASRIEFKLEDR